MKIPRFYNLKDYLEPNKVLVIYGSRQAGKTTLLKDFLEGVALKYKLDSGDNIRIQQVLSSEDFSRIIEYASGYDLIAVDEAQRIPKVGWGLKILVDEVKNIRIIATGSSSFELSGQVGEPLTGRKKTLTLYPISQLELKKIYNPYELKERLGEWLVFGGYPAVITAEGKEKKISVLEEIVDSYLLKDILELERIKNSRILTDLLRLLAFQVGSEVSLSELGGKLGIDYKTVARYLDLLEKSFIIFTLGGFSRNLRKEISKKNKYYFFDNGIRNAVVSNFNGLELRDDAGKLWENFMVAERLKKQAYGNISANNYFWRTWGGKEIDWIEEREGKLYGFEFKWNKGNVKAPKDWIKTYPEAEFQVITKDNYLEFVG
ncbi:MAG: ATP-binding protein [Patescibacteria group bacterium]|jgi:hypothetical protein